MLSKNEEFKAELVREYPKSNQKLEIFVGLYDMRSDSRDQKCHSIHISPHGLEFQTPQNLIEGTLIKIHIKIPKYWERKSKLVNYGRTNPPQDMKILAKVVESEIKGKRLKKRNILAETVNIDQIDLQILDSFIREKK